MEAVTDSIQTENVVASTSIDQELDLGALNAALPDAQYDPAQFPGLVYRTVEPKAATLVFRSGKLVCTGAQSEDEVRAALEIVFGKLRELGVVVPTNPVVTVQNIVSSADFEQPLNLNAITIGIGLENVEYEPEQFPGLVYRLDDPGVVVLLFGSGKLVITGAKTTDEAEIAMNQVHERLDDLDLLD